MRYTFNITLSIYIGSVLYFQKAGTDRMAENLSEEEGMEVDQIDEEEDIERNLTEILLCWDRQNLLVQTPGTMERVNAGIYIVHFDHFPPPPSV